MNCLHKDFYWQEVTNKQGVFKLKMCADCEAFLRDILFQPHPEINDLKDPHPEVNTIKDPHQPFFDGMFKCYDKVTERYPDMKEENREAMAVSLFIQICKS